VIERQRGVDRLANGYKASGWLIKEMRDLQRVSLLRSSATAALDLGLIFGCGALGYWLIGLLPIVLALITIAVLTVVSARSMRGLECLVHDASHMNWSRRRVVNDIAANLLAGWPLMNDVDSYRQTHLLHHSQLGSSEDTDLARWVELDLVHLRRGEPLRFGAGLFRRLVPYMIGWWQAVGLSWRTVAKFTIWQAVAFALACLLFGTKVAVIVWVVGWVIPFVFVLPIVRFIGEIEEHRYDGTETVVEATYTNVGLLQRLVFHPHADAYHTFHHLFAAIPFYRTRRCHLRLMEDNLGGYRDLITERSSVCSPAALVNGASTESAASPLP
jgi:fatty acid desaturase